MTRESIPTTLTLAILGLVSQEPLSGYDVRKIFATTPMGHFSTSPGAIYPALRRMEKNGWIKGSVEKRHSLRLRQPYTIAREGRRILEQRLLEPISHDDVVWRLEDLMLRFAFMGGVFGREHSLRFLRELASRIDGYVPYLKKHLEIQRKQKRMTGAYALERGLAVYRETAQWARRVIGELEREEGA